METKLYHISAGFAQRQNIPMVFVGVQIRETSGAIYVVGQGTTESAKLGICCKCGRTLTHPVSVALGIGPECGGHFHNWAAVGGYTMDNIERLKGEMKNIKFQTWIPKACVKQTHPTAEVVDIPESAMPKAPAASGSASSPSSGTEPKIKGTIATGHVQSTNQAVLVVKFPFDRETLEFVKAIEGRKFHSEGEKFWTVPANKDNYDKLTKAGFEPNKDAISVFGQPAKASKPAPKKILDVSAIPGLKGKLRPFQEEGVRFIEAKGGRALIADEMGLGKTVQALAWLQAHPENRPALIVVPASLKHNWSKEANMWMTSPCIKILSGTTPAPISSTEKVLIINYDILPDWIETLSKINLKVVIFDEVHYLKNSTAQRTKAAKKLVKTIPFIICLSGTPIINRPIEFYNTISMINPTLFANSWAYAHRYCGARHNGYGWDFSGATNVQELHEKLSNSIMIRRTKAQVLKELPPKMYSLIPLRLDNQTEYDNAERDFIHYLKETKGAQAAASASNAEALVSIEGLKQLAANGKLKASIEWIENFIESGEKLVVMATHKEVISALYKAFEKVAVVVDGSVDVSKRQYAVDKFQNDPDIKVFIGNIKAAGVGLTLTAASNVVFLEYPWTPGELSQAEDRCHRIGQPNSVNIWYLVGAFTIDHKIVKLINSKKKVLEQVLDGTPGTDMSIMSDLLNMYNFQNE